MLNKATVYRFTHPVSNTLTGDRLENFLAKTPSKDCHSTQSSTIGWSEVLPGTKNFVHQSGDTLYFKVRICEKKIPPKALKSETDRRVRVIESQRGEKVKSTEKTEIVDQIRLEFLPKTIQTESSVTGAIHLTEGYLIVDEAPKKADSFCTFLRQTIGTLPIVIVGAEQSTHFVFSQMITEELELANVQLGDAVTLENLETKEKATFSKADLHSDEVKAHVNSEMFPKKIKMHFSDSSSAVVTDELAISGIKISDAVKDQQGINDIEDYHARINTELFIWTAAVIQMLQLLNPGLNLVPSRP